MTAPVDDLQVQAGVLLDLLRADPVLTVYDGVVPTGVDQPDLPYVLAYIHITDSTTRMPELSIRSVVRVYAHSVGATPEAARIVAGRVRTALLDVVPTVPGRRAWPIRHESSIPPTRDESTGRVVMDQVDVYRLQTESAQE